MSKGSFTFICGLTAGIIDIIPMLIQKLNAYSITSAFVQWLVVAFVINYIVISLRGAFKGLLIAVAMAVPIIIIVIQSEISAAVPMLIMSVLLGSGIGYVSEKHAKSRLKSGNFDNF